MDELTQAMQRPNFYPHQVTEPIGEITTHISHVFLTGPYAYKIKRHVNLGFLDFHTVDQRKYFCHEELRLNMRFSKQLYLGVLPIYQTPERGYYLGDLEEKLEPVDWALKMKQFPQSDLFSNLVKNEEVGEEDFRELGIKLAVFHQKAVTDEEILQFGTVSKYLEVIAQNENTTREYVDKLLSREVFQETMAFQVKFIAENKAYFKERQDQKKIRECHGDLHLENVVMFEKEPLPFDCIEFNKSFKFIDCLYDLAFLFMDLLKNNRPDLAYAFLNSYLENTGDYKGIVLLNFFTSLRAYVRGKICSFKLDSCHEKDREALKKDAIKFFELAHQCSQTKKGKVLCISGVSGSGKSTLAKKLASQIEAIHIRSDVVRKHLGQVPLMEKGPDSLYSEEMTQRTYDKLLKKSLVLTQYGLNVILDAKYDQKEIRDDLILHCMERDIPLGLIQCEAPKEVLEERLKARVGDVSDAGVDLLSSQLENFDEIKNEDILLKLDTSKSSEEQIVKALNFWKSLK